MHPALRRTALASAAALLLPLFAFAAPARAGDARPSDPARSDPARSEAEARLSGLDQHDAAAAYRLALDLEAKGFKDLASKAYEIVVGLEPEHLAARRALGFEKIDER